MEKQTVQLEKVTVSDGAPWRPDRDAPVLVLGDSYTNIYSSEDLGWGESSGFAEHLSLALGYRVDKLARNDSGARAAREMLGAEAARVAGWLDGKKVVVWVMAAREFVSGDWKPVPLPGPGASAAMEFLVVPRGESLEVEATVRAMGPLPEPGDTPYADYLTALHLSDMREASTGREMAGDALAYIYTMRGRKPVRLPDLVEGARVKLRLSNYAENADTLDPLNRGELDDVEVMMQDPNYAEWTELP
jgi:alginate O-acetyltransferase complex protein AlgJ